MAQDTIDEVLKMNSQRVAAGVAADQLIDTSRLVACNTEGQKLIGAGGWSLQLPITMSRLGFAQDVADHLAHNYGTQHTHQIHANHANAQDGTAQPTHEADS